MSREELAKVKVGSIVEFTNRHPNGGILGEVVYKEDDYVVVKHLEDGVWFANTNNHFTKPVEVAHFQFLYLISENAEES